mgnify:CR=1 FL=1
MQGAFGRRLILFYKMQILRNRNLQGIKLMKNERKLLRKLLAAYRNELVEKPCTDERSRHVDALIFIIEGLNEQNRNS